MTANSSTNIDVKHILPKARLASPFNQELTERLMQASLVILGTTDPKKYWGLDLMEFAILLEAGLRKYIVEPANMAFPECIEQYQALAGKPIHVNEALAWLDGSPTAAQTITPEVADEVAARTRVIGLNGPIGCGKDTLADVMIAEHGFVRMSFADALRAAASIIYHIPMDYFLDRNLKEEPLPHMNGMSPRKVLQLMGTEVCRGIREDIWARRLVIRIAAQGTNITGEQRVVISDVRFQNEADLVRSLPNGQIGRITRPTESSSTAVLKSAAHASEAGISAADTDIPLVNAGTIPEYLMSSLDALSLTQRAPTRRLRA